MFTNFTCFLTCFCWLFSRDVIWKPFPSLIRNYQPIGTCICYSRWRSRRQKARDNDAFCGTQWRRPARVTRAQPAAGCRPSSVLPAIISLACRCTGVPSVPKPRGWSGGNTMSLRASVSNLHTWRQARAMDVGDPWQCSSRGLPTLFYLPNIFLR